MKMPSTKGNAVLTTVAKKILNLSFTLYWYDNYLLRVQWSSWNCPSDAHDDRIGWQILQSIIFSQHSLIYAGGEGTWLESRMGAANRDGLMVRWFAEPLIIQKIQNPNNILRIPSPTMMVCSSSLCGPSFRNIDQWVNREFLCQKHNLFWLNI